VNEESNSNKCWIVAVYKSKYSIELKAQCGNRNTIVTDFVKDTRDIEEEYEVNERTKTVEGRYL
jgi:hypothetical protein